MAAGRVRQQLPVPLPHALARHAEVPRDFRERHAGAIEHAHEPFVRAVSVAIFEDSHPMRHDASICFLQPGTPRKNKKGPESVSFPGLGTTGDSAGLLRVHRSFPARSTAAGSCSGATTHAGAGDDHRLILSHEHPRRVKHMLCGRSQPVLRFAVMTSQRAFRLMAACTIVCSTISAAAQAPSDLDARARAIHQHILILDSHTDVLLPNSPENLYAPGHTSHTDFDKLKKGGVGAVAVAIAVGNGPRTAEGVAAARAEADAKLTAIRVFLKDHADQAALAVSAADIVRLHKAGKVAVIESFLNTRSIGSDLSAIDGFYRDGVRLFGFTHAGNNDFADSSRPSGEPAEEHHGLSPIGKQAVAKLNRLGVIIDISQLTPAGVMQVLELSKAPVIASHSNVRALVDNTRTLSDRELDAIKVNGGIVDVTPFNNYLRRVPPDLEAQARARLPRATVSDLVDHIDYIVKRIGIDHVGIGTDFNHGAGIEGFDDESEAPNVTRELVRRGYTEAQIAKISGGTSCVSSDASRPSRQKCGRCGPSALRTNLRSGA